MMKTEGDREKEKKKKERKKRKTNVTVSFSLDKQNNRKSAKPREMHSQSPTRAFHKHYRHWSLLRSLLETGGDSPNQDHQQTSNDEAKHQVEVASPAKPVVN